ncbi:DNA ligase [Pseudomonas phage phiPsa267]|uniref:DNA ligase n=3 Tax=Otagovirus TaxID=2560197 RepID=A0A7G9V0R4_9CAUD|nr:DNA ligase [Pseudomonas phage phiPsa381]YP_010767650.1 DNA ligase [Pseudomonas phage phiPsa267]QNN99869.1 DNA ligase [Pseudomonas phage phiPsa267]QNO00563.1 DNA ligase [Pseudomonas phage phiPsa381]
MIKTLYGLDKKGEMKVWTITTSTAGEITISHGKLGGKMTVKNEIITEGKQGRTVGEQADLEARARIKKQEDKNYRENQIDLQSLDILAMLAADYRKRGKSVVFPCFGSDKYDGVRALAKKRDGVVTIESRTSQAYDIPHIHAALTIHMRDGDIWDGEIYLHGEVLQDITSAVGRTDTQGKIEEILRKIGKAKDAEKKALLEAELVEARLIHEIRPKLEFHIFDVHSDKTFYDRVSDLEELCGIPVVSPCIQITQYVWVADEADMKVKHDDAVNRGYEGLMLRNFKGLYESGKRSSDLQKYKEFVDAEFEILDVLPDSDEGSRFLVRNNLNDRTFTVTLGSMVQRAEYLANKHLYIGKMITVRYQSRYKKTKLPQFPTGVVIRDYE